LTKLSFDQPYISATNTPNWSICCINSSTPTALPHTALALPMQQEFGYLRMSVKATVALHWRVFCFSKKASGITITRRKETSLRLH